MASNRTSSLTAEDDRFGTEDEDLFGRGLPQRWLPDETLYSLCSRHHLLSGNHLASSTCRALFGHPRLGSAHDFPSRLAHFATRTRQQLGSADEIIRVHTVLPFYLPFADPAVARSAVAAMAGPAIGGGFKFQLGLLSSRFRANHPLKVCSACMSADREKWSVAYWHVAHQLPGVWACPVHRAALVPSTVKATGVRRFHWILPGESHLNLKVGGAEPAAAVVAMSMAAARLWSLPPGTHFDASQTSQTHRARLRHLDLLRGDGRGRLRHHDIGSRYAEHLRQLRMIPELGALPANPEEAAREVGRFAREPRAGYHPLRQIALITWLYEDFEAFLQLYRMPPERPPTAPRVEDEAEPMQDPRRGQLLQLMASGSSASGAARMLGVDPATAIAWAATAGIATKKRPSILRGDLRDRMVTALQEGYAKSRVAAIGGVSIESVTRLLRTEVWLRAKWRAAQFAAAQQDARGKWTRLVRANPHAGIKAARLVEPAAYAWLYRNDRVWLDEQCALFVRIQPMAKLRVRWDARDRDLAADVGRIGVTLSLANPGKKIKLWQIYQQLPALKAKLAKLDKLPLTSASIKQVLRAHTDHPTLGYADRPATEVDGPSTTHQHALTPRADGHSP